MAAMAAAMMMLILVIIGSIGCPLTNDRNSWICIISALLTFLN
jgi:hypothetical protein